MKQSWWLRFSLLVFLTLISIAVLVPTIFNLKEDSAYPIKSKISLGLDLQGGLYMILGIDFKKVYRDEIRSYIRKMEYVLADEGIKASAGELVETEPMDPRHTLILANAADAVKAEAKIKEFFPSLVRLTNQKDNSLEYGLSALTRGQIEEQSVSKSIEVIRNRIDEFGVTEPEIVSQGKDRIIVALPGVKDIERAKDLIGKTAKLEFKMVNDEISPAKIQEWLDKATKAGIEFKKGERFSEYLEKLNTHLKADIPEGYALAFEKRLNPATNETLTSIPYVVDSAPRLTGDELQDARVQIDQQKNEPYVSMDFKSAGAKRFEEITGGNIGKRMAVILDGNVYTAPVIQAKIGGGRAQITLGTGNFNKLMKEARDIALVLRAGALPVQLDFEEQRTVGPSLGHDSINKAVVASVVACIAVFIFCIVYYKFSGVLAIITLVLNVLFVLATLVGLEGTLTLPGIAGIALTVGMAIDGNIIIYERIRDGVRVGMGNFKSVESGFAQAFWTILDANITTALAGLCLLNFGTGPIRGFAVTLIIGLTATVYCAYFVSKLLFEYYMHKVEGRELSI
jgi:preprotein translocase subunit SecD